MAKDYTLEKRKYVVALSAIAIVVVYLLRLVDLQLLTDDYKRNADSNAFLNKIQYPSRGAIYDRNGKLVKTVNSSNENTGDFEVELLSSPEAGGTFEGAGFYNEGDVAMVKAVPAEGYVFVKWNDDVLTPERSITITDDISLVATFKKSTTDSEAGGGNTGGTDNTGGSGSDSGSGSGSSSGSDSGSGGSEDGGGYYE